MDKSKIEWCDMAFNPITGCLGINGKLCEYCYAKGTARRFGGFEPRCGGEVIPKGEGTCPGSIHNATHGKTLHIFDKQPMRRLRARGYPNGKFVKTSYPYNFEPTFHRYRLDEPQSIKETQTIFVGSMADMFGDWVPDEWIVEVFKACEAASWHRYLFLTKNPKRYTQDPLFFSVPPGSYKKWWFGTTVCNQAEYNTRAMKLPLYRTCFLSIEPMQDAINTTIDEFNDLKTLPVKWVIIGAETGNRKGKIIPKREWIENIVNACREAKIPVFLKNNLADAGVWGKKELIQEYPF